MEDTWNFYQNDAKKEWNQSFCNLKGICKSLDTKSEISTASQFNFDLSMEAARNNLKLLQEHKFDFREIWESNPNSVDNLGSEFRAQSQLEPIFQKHLIWHKLKELIKKGASFTFNDRS